MNKGESTPQGGRPPYVLEDEDIQLAKRLAKHGYTKKAIASALGFHETTFYEIMSRDEEFSKSIKRGIAEHCADSEDRVLAGNLTPTQYIYWSKTKWKNFYPQETREVEQPKTNTVEMTEELALKLIDVAANHRESKKENQNQQKAI